MTPPNPPTRDRAALLPCPFCGETPRLDGDGDYAWVTCDVCCIRKVEQFGDAQARAIVVWNTRPTAPGDDLVTRSAARVERDIDDMHAALSGKPFGPLDDPTDTAPGDGLAGVVVTEAMRREIAEAERQRLLNTPELRDFSAAVTLEALHQRERWGVEQDAGKAPADWFWLLGYLAGKALAAANAGNTEKALHHTISSAAALANWHAALLGADTKMRPGIEPPANLLPLPAPKEPTT